MRIRNTLFYPQRHTDSWNSEVIPPFIRIMFKASPNLMQISPILDSCNLATRLSFRTVPVFPLSHPRQTAHCTMTVRVHSIGNYRILSDSYPSDIGFDTE